MVNLQWWTPLAAHDSLEWTYSDWTPDSQFGPESNCHGQKYYYYYYYYLIIKIIEVVQHMQHRAIAVDSVSVYVCSLWHVKMTITGKHTPIILRPLKVRK